MVYIFSIMERVLVRFCELPVPIIRSSIMKGVFSIIVENELEMIFKIEINRNDSSQFDMKTTSDFLINLN